MKNAQDKGWEDCSFIHHFPILTIEVITLSQSVLRGNSDWQSISWGEKGKHELCFYSPQIPYTCANPWYQVYSRRACLKCSRYWNTWCTRPDFDVELKLCIFELFLAVGHLTSSDTDKNIFSRNRSVHKSRRVNFCLWCGYCYMLSSSIPSIYQVYVWLLL